MDRCTQEWAVAQLAHAQVELAVWSPAVVVCATWMWTCCLTMDLAVWSPVVWGVGWTCEFCCFCSTAFESASLFVSGIGKKCWWNFGCCGTHSVLFCLVATRSAMLDVLIWDKTFSGQCYFWIGYDVRWHLCALGPVPEVEHLRAAGCRFRGMQPALAAQVWQWESCSFCGDTCLSWLGDDLAVWSQGCWRPCCLNVDLLLDDGPGGLAPGCLIVWYTLQRV